MANPYYAPIVSALRDINNNMRLNRQERRQAENDIFKHSMARMELEAKLSDPQRKLGIIQARHMIQDVGIRLPGTTFDDQNSPEAIEQQKFYREQLQSSMGYEGSVFRNKDGFAVDTNGNLITDPRIRAIETEKRLWQGHALQFGANSEAAHTNKLRNFQKQKDELQTKHLDKALLKQELDRINKAEKKYLANYNNPINRLHRINSKVDSLRAYKTKMAAQGFNVDNIKWADTMIEGLLKDKKLLLAEAGDGTKWGTTKMAVRDARGNLIPASVQQYYFPKDQKSAGIHKKLTTEQGRLNADDWGGPGSHWYPVTEKDLGDSGAGKAKDLEAELDKYVGKMTHEQRILNILQNKEIRKLEKDQMVEQVIERGGMKRDEAEELVAQLTSKASREQAIQDTKTRITQLEQTIQRRGLWDRYQGAVTETLLNDLDPYGLRFKSETGRKKVLDKLKTMTDDPETLEYYKKYLNK